MAGRTGLRIVTAAVEEAAPPSRAAPCGIDMPRSNTDITHLLAGDRRVRVAFRSSRRQDASARALEPDLARLVAAWPALSHATRTAILTIAEVQEEKDG